MTTDLEQHMNQTLKRLGIHNWQAVWTPERGSVHGEAFPEDRLIVVYDADPHEAWRTFSHELLELKLRPVLQPYHSLCNALIEWAEGQTYRAKEQFIDTLARARGSRGSRGNM